MFKNSTFICMLLMSCIANAKMYKCTDTNGTVSFKDSPCADGQSTEWQKETEAEIQNKKYQQRQLEQQQKKAELDALLKRANKQTIEDEARWFAIDYVPDDVMVGIKYYLDAVLKDPDSIKDFKTISKQSNGSDYRTKVFFRAKNGWGAYGISEMEFISKEDGNIVKVKDTK